MHSYMYTVVNNKRKNTEFRGIVLVECRERAKPALFVALPQTGVCRVRHFGASQQNFH